jgi:hypothetical protein
VANLNLHYAAKPCVANDGAMAVAVGLSLSSGEAARYLRYDVGSSDTAIGTVHSHNTLTCVHMCVWHCMICSCKAWQLGGPGEIANRGVRLSLCQAEHSVLGPMIALSNY